MRGRVVVVAAAAAEVVQAAAPAAVVVDRVDLAAVEVTGAGREARGALAAAERADLGEAEQAGLGEAWTPVAAAPVDRAALVDVMTRADVAREASAAREEREVSAARTLWAPTAAAERAAQGDPAPADQTAASVFAPVKAQADRA